MHITPEIFANYFLNLGLGDGVLLVCTLLLLLTFVLFSLFTVGDVLEDTRTNKGD